jgi:hypothetical protein
MDFHDIFVDISKIILWLKTKYFRQDALANKREQPEPPPFIGRNTKKAFQGLKESVRQYP